MLKKKNPNIQLPEYSMNSEFKMMQLSYNMLVRRLTVDSTVENYKQYLIYGFMAMEMLIGKFTPINMSGFTLYQQNSMNQYERLLVELGEKTDPAGKSILPVEIRLVILVAINTAIFVASRVLFSSENAAKFLTSLSTAATPQEAPRKMRRPDE